jgi:hypothetical protein
MVWVFNDRLIAGERGKVLFYRNGFEAIGAFVRSFDEGEFPELDEDLV